MKDSKYKEVPWMTGRWKKLATTSNRGFAPQSTCKYKQWLCSEKQYDDRVNTENSKHRLNVETPSLHNPYAKRRWKDVSQLVFRSVVFLLSWKFGLDTSLSEKLYRVCYIPHDGGFFSKHFWIAKSLYHLMKVLQNVVELFEKWRNKFHLYIPIFANIVNVILQ